MLVYELLSRRVDNDPPPAAVWSVHGSDRVETLSFGCDKTKRKELDPLANIGGPTARAREFFKNESG